MSAGPVGQLVGPHWHLDFLGLQAKRGDSCSPSFEDDTLTKFKRPCTKLFLVALLATVTGINPEGILKSGTVECIVLKFSEDVLLVTKREMVALQGRDLDCSTLVNCLK